MIGPLIKRKIVRTDAYRLTDARHWHADRQQQEKKIKNRKKDEGKPSMHEKKLQAFLKYLNEQKFEKEKHHDCEIKAPSKQYRDLKAVQVSDKLRYYEKLDHVYYRTPSTEYRPTL